MALRSTRPVREARLAAILVAGAGVLGLGGVAHATDGYFANGYGEQAKGLAGAVLAYPKDTLAIATNPAAAFTLGNRADVDIDYFQSWRQASITGNAYGPNKSYGGDGGGPSPIPEFGVTKRLNDKWAMGLAIYANGGMITNYKTNPYARFGATGTAGVSLEQVFIAPTVAYEIAPGHSIGVSLDIGGQQFRARGLQPFAGFSADPTHFTDKGFTTAWGYGAKIGYLGQLTPRLSLGAFYQTRTFSGKFGPYAGLFADHGAFDTPSTYGLGGAFKATGKLDLVGEVRRINFSEVPSVGNSLDRLFAGVPFGAAGGPGFGWRDSTVVKIGANYRINPAWQVRAGWGHADNPVPQSQTLLNILAPGVVENQFTVGATWTQPSGLEISGYVMDAPKNTVSGSGSIPGGPHALGGGEANISMSELAFGFGVGWKY
jgi:long-chain fatty acid transport protein